jgi:5'-nucleotidase
VLSGVNLGRNAGEDVTYSGTVAGAMEGAVLNIPSVALSQAYAMSDGKTPHWDTAIKYGPDLIKRVLAEGIPKDVLVNINFPDCAPDKVQGVSVTTQGKRNQAQMAIEERRDGRGNPYYWIAFKGRQKPATRDNTDLWALADNRISITPLRLDMTDDPYMTRLAKVFG